MQPGSWRPSLPEVRRVLWNLLLLGVGSALSAVAINGILVPQQFVSGGFVGLALVLYYLTQHLPVAALYLLLNVPVFALGWMFVGRRFFLYSMAGMVIFSIAVNSIQVTLPVQDRIPAALLAGLISGAGAGIILRSLGSAGGADILAVFLFQRFSIRPGMAMLGFNVLVLSMAAVLFTLEGALYTLIYLYITSHVMNVVVTGMSQRKAVFIISLQWEEIRRHLLDRVERGLTLIEGQGGYSGRDERILYTVITFRDLPRLKRLVRQIDPNAFMVVTDTLEVMGAKVGNQPHW